MKEIIGTLNWENCYLCKHHLIETGGCGIDQDKLDENLSIDGDFICCGCFEEINGIPS